MGIYFQGQRIDSKPTKCECKNEDSHYYCFKNGPIDSNGKCNAAYIQGTGTVEKYYSDYYHTSTNTITLSDISGGDNTFWTKFLNGEQVSFPNGANYSVVLNFSNKIALSSCSMRTIYGVNVCQALDEFHVYGYNSSNQWVELGNFTSGAAAPGNKSISASSTFFTNKIKLVAKDLTDGYGYPGVATEFNFNATEQESVSTAKKIYFRVNESNPLVGVLANGEEFTRTSIPEINCASLSNGTYNIFIGKEGNAVVYANTVFVQASEPTRATNNIWINNSVYPFTSKRYNGSSWVDFEYVRLPQTFKMQGGVVSQVTSIGGYGPYANWGTKNHITSSTPAVVVDSYSSGSNGYRIWSDGLIEQWGQFNHNATEFSTVSFLKPYTDINYSIQLTMTSTDGTYVNNSSTAHVAVFNKTKQSFATGGHASTECLRHKDWYAIGF